MRETKPKPRAVAQARKPIKWQGSKLPLLNALVPMVQAIEHTLSGLSGREGSIERLLERMRN